MVGFEGECRIDGEGKIRDGWVSAVRRKDLGFRLLVGVTCGVSAARRKDLTVGFRRKGLTAVHLSPSSTLNIALDPVNMSQTRPTVIVFGATGLQGGSVLKALLEAGEYQLRAVTSNPKLPAAQNLAEQCVELITGDANHRIPWKQLLMALGELSSRPTFGNQNRDTGEISRRCHCGLQERRICCVVRSCRR